MLRAPRLAAAMLIALCLTAAQTTPASAQTYSTTIPPVSIPDNTPAGASMSIQVPDAFQVSSLVVTVGVTHTWINDLRLLELTAPNGQVISLWPTGGIGSSGDNLKHTTLDSTAALQIGSTGATVAPFRNRFRPVGAIPAGLPSSGTWSLRAVDGVNQDIGTLDYFILSFNEQVRIGQAGSAINQASASTSPSQTGLTVSIPDGDSTTGATSWLTIDQSDSLQISGIDLAFSVTHTNLADLRIRLIHPSGSPSVDVVIPSAMSGAAATPITDAAGTPNRPYVTTLVDSVMPAAPLSTGTAPYRGRFAPSNSFESFHGLPSAGTWTLQVFDHNANALTGSIREWSLHVRGAPYIPTGMGAASPPAIPPGGTTQLRVTVTPSANSTLSAVTAVTADIGELSGLGAGDNITLARVGTTADWTAQVTTSASLGFGAKSVPFTITEAAGAPTGTGTISVTIVPASDECHTTPLIVGFGPAALSGSSWGATTSFVPIASSCGTATGAGGGRDVFARFTPPATAAYSLDLCGSAFDTVLAIFSACPVSSAVQLACNDDSTANIPCSGTSSTQSRIPSVVLTAGHTYIIRIAGWNDNSGNYTLNVNYTDPLAPGTCCNGATCTLTDAASCAGVFTPGAACLPSTCGAPPTENCCRGTTCTQVSSGTCMGTSTGGSVGIVVSSCGAGNSLSTCCFADFNHDGIQSIDDLFLYFNAYFTDSPLSNVGGDGVASPMIDDLFMYINAYFTGCQP